MKLSVQAGDPKIKQVQTNARQFTISSIKTTQILYMAVFRISILSRI